jgi:hypothetical protein
MCFPYKKLFSEFLLCLQCLQIILMSERHVGIYSGLLSYFVRWHVLVTNVSPYLHLRYIHPCVFVWGYFCYMCVVIYLHYYSISWCGGEWARCSSAPTVTLSLWLSIRAWNALPQELPFWDVNIWALPGLCHHHLGWVIWESQSWVLSHVNLFSVGLALPWCLGSFVWLM